jgi:hypothetical protein
VNKYPAEGAIMKGILLTVISVVLFACDAVDVPAVPGPDDERAETGTTIEEDDALEPEAAEDPVAGDEPSPVAALSSCGSTPLYKYTCLTNCAPQVSTGACGGKGYYWLCDRHVHWKMADSADVFESSSYIQYCSQTNNCPGTCN